MTITTDLTTLINTEDIERLILGVHVSTPIALQFSWTDSVGPGRGNNQQIPRINNVTVPAGTKAENADFTLVNASTAAENVSGGWVGYSDQLSWEAQNQPTTSGLQVIVSAGLPAISDRIDVDGLSTLAGATNSTSFTLAQLTDNGVLQALAAFIAQRPHQGDKFFAIYTTQYRDWAQDLNTSGGNQLGGNQESERVAALLGLTDGFVGVRHGLRIFSSENVPTAAGDATGAMGKMGMGGPLAYRSWAPIEWDTDWNSRSKSWIFTLATFYGWVLTDQANVHAVISRST